MLKPSPIMQALDLATSAAAGYIDRRVDLGQAPYLADDDILDFEETVADEWPELSAAELNIVVQKLVSAAGRISAIRALV